MSGSRRNRTNLNVQVDPANAPGRQASQPQPGSAAIQYQYQQPKTVNMLNLVSEHRPMSIQYVPPNAPQWPGATTQMINGVRSPQVQPQPPRAALSTAFAAAQPRPNPPDTGFVLDRLIAAIIPVLTTHQQSVATRVEKMETFIEELTTNMKETKDETQKQTKQVVEAMQKAFAMQQAGNKALHERMAKLEKTIGASDTGNHKKSLRNCLDVISFTVEELLERAKDPEAPGIDRPIPETPIVSREIYTDKGTDSQTPEPQTPPPQVIPPIFVQHATSPMRQLYTDASNGPMTPVPSTPPRERQSPVRLAYVDVANDPLDPESPAPTVQSLVRPVYTDVSVNPRTPPPSEPPRQYLSTAVATSPIADLPRLSISSFRRYSEDALTLVGDASCVETKSADDLNEANVSPKLKRKRVKAAHDLEDDDVDMVPLEDVPADAQFDGGKPDKLNCAKGVRMRSRFNTSPMPSKSLSAVDWSDGDRDDPHSDDDNDNTSSLPVFRPTSSPSVAKQYSLLKRRRESLDGTVASLRQETLGDGHAIPAPSPSPQPIIPFHPRPSVSPLPSPESSPSPPPSSARSRFKFGRVEIQTTTPSPERREPIIVSSPASVSSPVLEEQITTPAPVVSISSPALEQSSSSLVPGESISSPARETPARTAEEAKLSPLSPSAQVKNVISDSEDESELSVRRMITETFENLEPVMQPAPPPLFLPSSVSPSNSPSAVPDYTSPSPTPKKPPPKTRVPVLLSRSRSPVTNSSVSAKKSELTVSALKRAQVAIKKPSLPSIKIPSPRKFMNPAAPKLSPTISPKISPIITSTRPKPRRITVAPHPQLPPQPRVIVSVPSSPIYIPSRTPSPLSSLSGTSSSSEFDHGNDYDSDVRIIPAKKRVGLKLKIDAKPGPRASPSTNLSGSPSSNANANEKGGDTRPPHVDLKKKLLNKSGQSAAVTRVKKRKALSMEEMEPPLKRARQKAGADVIEEEDRMVAVRLEKKCVGASSSKGKGKEKEKGEKGGRARGKEKSGSSVSSSTGTATKRVGAKSRPRAPPPPGCKWPEKNKTGDKKFNQQFVECDVCFSWYHYGCVGVTDSKDVRIKGGELFTCPPCSSGGANPMVPRNDNIVCARPDCGQEEKRPDEFFMTGIIGRSTRVQSGTGRKYIWLVKWEGYSIKDCTWEGEDGMTDPQSFIQHFNEAAAREGIDPEEDPHSTILLREAIASGWKDPNA